MKQAIKRRLTGLVLSAILLAALALPAFAADIPAAPSGHAVLDQAGVLSQETINTVDGYNNALSSTGAQIAVLTVDFTGNLSIDDYALQVFNEWGIGDKKKQNGVLFLLVTGDQNAYCTIGTGLEGEITYSRIKQLLEDYARDGVKSGNYDDAVVQFTGAMYSELCSLYGITPGEAGGAGRQRFVRRAADAADRGGADYSYHRHERPRRRTGRPGRRRWRPRP